MKLLFQDAKIVPTSEETQKEIDAHWARVRAGIRNDQKHEFDVSLSKEELRERGYRLIEQGVSLLRMASKGTP